MQLVRPILTRPAVVRLGIDRPRREESDREKAADGELEDGTHGGKAHVKGDDWEEVMVQFRCLLLAERPKVRDDACTQCTFDYRRSSIESQENRR